MEKICRKNEFKARKVPEENEINSPEKIPVFGIYFRR
jgi:hypothetical protein